MKPFRILKAPLPGRFIIVENLTIVGYVCSIAQAMDEIARMLR